MSMSMYDKQHTFTSARVASVGLVSKFKNFQFVNVFTISLRKTD